MGEFKIIEDSLIKLAPIVITELQDELTLQKHIASKTLYDGFKRKLKADMTGISLHIINDTKYMWVVNNGNNNGVKVGYQAIHDWAMHKVGRGELKFTSLHSLNNFISSVKSQLEDKYLTAGGDKVAGGRRYFFIDIVVKKIKKGSILSDLKESIKKQVRQEVKKGLYSKELKVTIG